MLLNDVMDYKEAGQRASKIIDEWNKTNWEDTDFIESKADISNKDVLALIICFTEMRNCANIGIEKVRHYRSSLIEYGEHKNICAKLEGGDHKYPCNCGLDKALQHKMKRSERRET